MKMAVASCAKLKHTNPQPVWAEIQTERPDVLLLLGDNIYLDEDRHDDPVRLAAELREKYDAQMREPAFAALLADQKARGATTLAIYDDHDFMGDNRYGGDHGPGLRDAARDAFIRVFKPKMTGRDVYSVSSFGLVDVVVLDERYYRTSPDRASRDSDAILGPDQWKWLVSTLAASKARYVVIASSTTVHDFGGNERWGQYPGALQRLTDLLAHQKGRMIISGDVHKNAFGDDAGVVEIVTSGVARNGVVGRSPRKNYAILTFDPNEVRVDLRSLTAKWRFDFAIPLSTWELPGSTSA